VTAVEDTGAQGLSLTGTLRLTRVSDRLAHILDDSQGTEAIGTWTGLACPDHGLQIGSDVDNATLLHLAGQGEIADLVWEPPADFTTEHGQACAAAIQAHLSGRSKEGEHFWEQVVALWSQAWSANYQVLELMQQAGLTRFSPSKPQRWVIASFGHHTGPHGLSDPHIHNIVIPALTASVGR
jgi:hypothetical protein